MSLCSAWHALFPKEIGILEWLGVLFPGLLLAPDFLFFLYFFQVPVFFTVPLSGGASQKSVSGRSLHQPIAACKDSALMLWRCWQKLPKVDLYEQHACVPAPSPSDTTTIFSWESCWIFFPVLFIHLGHPSVPCIKQCLEQLETSASKIITPG